MTRPPAMWGGRFAAGPDPVFRELNDSLPVDWRLVREDIEGSIAWAEALAACGVISTADAARIDAELRDLALRAAALPGPPLESGAEDVHSWVEARLVDRLGDAGKRLHTGRSRNDQVATDLKLWTRRQLARRIAEVRDLQRALLELCGRAAGAPFPGFTHLQRAQPVLLAHWALAYVEMLDRDAVRFAEAFRRAGLCPLGSGALSGTAWPVDRDAIARRLGFDGPTANSMDAVSDRDFAADAAYAAALCSTHLSRLGEEIVVFSTAEFGLVSPDEGVSSGSSLMPQKKNPDAAEILRARPARIAGALVALLTLLKGLPLAYNKDLQDDKPALFDAMDQASGALRLAARLVRGLAVDLDACRDAARGGHANATELADYLVRRGVPFREAHEAVGRLVREAIERDAGLEDLPMEVVASITPAAGPDFRGVLTLDASLARRDVPGGTAPARVLAACREAAARVASAADPREPAGPLDG